MLREKGLTRRLGVGDGRDELFAGRGSTLTQHASMERKGSERQRRRRRRQRRPTPLTMRTCEGRGGGRQDKVKKQRKKHSEEPRPPLRDRADLQSRQEH